MRPIGLCPPRRLSERIVDRTPSDGGSVARTTHTPMEGASRSAVQSVLIGHVLSFRRFSLCELEVSAHAHLFLFQAIS